MSVVCLHFRQLGISYLLATSGALVTALGLNSLVKVDLHFVMIFALMLRLVTVIGICSSVDLKYKSNSLKERQ